MAYWAEYAKRPMGKGNPYYCCIGCGRTDPDIKDELEYYATLPPRIITRIIMSDSGDYVDESVKFETINDLFQYIIIAGNVRLHRSDYLLSMDGWDYRRFDDDHLGAAHFYAALEDVGYQFSDRETERWKTFRTDSEDDDDIDDQD